MKTASQILEAKGYEGDEIDSILNWGNKESESLDMQTRKHYGIAEPIHLWDGYVIGDSDEDKLNAIALLKGFKDFRGLLLDMTVHLNKLASDYPDKTKN